MLTQKKHKTKVLAIYAFCSTFFMLGCQVEKKAENKMLSLPQTTRNTLLVVTSDYHSGELTTVDLIRGQITKLPVGIYSDAVVRSALEDSFLFVVNRLGADNIQWINRSNPKNVGQFSVGRLSNPQDIAVIDTTTAYVSRLASDRLLKVNPFTGDILKEIDLFELAETQIKSSTDSDRFPEMTWMKLWKGQLLILLQRLNSNEGYVPSDRSQIAFLDPKDDKVHKIIDLGSTNPVSQLKEWKGQLVLGEAGRLGLLDGKIEVFDEAFNTKRTVVTEKQLGGDIIDCLIANPTQGLAIILKDAYGQTPKTQLVSFSMANGEINSILKDTGKFSLHQLVEDKERGLFYLADRDPKSPGIWVYDSEKLELLSNVKYDVGLPPYHMELVK